MLSLAPLLLLLLFPATARAAPGDLLWADEFDIPGAPDTTKWSYDLGGGGWCVVLV